MKQALQLRLGQSLIMTPQLQQAIRLLQLSTAELSLEVQEALESNMMLEAVEDEHEDGSGSVTSPEAESLPYAETPIAASEVEDVAGAAIAQDIPEELPVDSAWDDVYDTAMPQAASGDHAGFEIENQRAAGESLKDHLLWQTNLAPISDMDKAIAYAIADALDNDGFLRTSLEELRQSLNQDQVELDEIEAVLHWVQRLDPPGVAARSLQECLAIQLSQQDGGSPWLEQARHLVEKHFDLLAERDYVRLARRMKLSREELQQVVALIQTMNPRPGAHLQDDRVEYIVPDVHVRKKTGTWQVELNAEVIPHLRVNPYYASMVRRADNSQDNTSLRTHLQEARWFIKSLQSRSQTLLRVATAIVERQRAFLELGDVAMKPLVLHDIAEVLGMHESTISRVTTRKYLHTPRGIYELKYFFSSHLSTSAGGECSSTAIRAVIKKLIAAESSLKPLSDSKLAAVLWEQGINVARRTVAKYREAMAIPPSNERKRLV
ncbi:MAG: RNA polymerase factor sigma-54 [Gammaproteobacteria bacterium]|nr:RNA polymerase factor sigma-54 [Gammaproteobacteria bacterium]